MRALIPALTAVLLMAACDDATGPDGLTVAVDPSVVDLVEGDTIRLTAVARNASGSVQDVMLTWTSADSTTAKVSSTGLVTARAAGEVRITARTGEDSGWATVRVSAAPPAVVDTVHVTAESTEVAEGATVRYTATPRDADGNPITGLAPLWTTSDESIARVDAGGLVIPVRPGTATISARVHGKSGSAAVHVTAVYGYDLLYDAWDGVAGHHNRALMLDINDPEGEPTDPFDEAIVMGNTTPSLDGQRIAFMGTVENLPGIWVMDRDGGNLVRVHSDPVNCGHLTFSPAADRLAFQCWPMGEAPDIWVVEADGTGLTNLTADPDAGQLSPAWSPVPVDGEYRIAYTHNQGGEMSIRTMRATDGGDIRILTSGAADDQAAWSPDGSTIAFARSGGAIFGDLYLVDADGENVRGLVARAGPQWSPAWSPDGALVAFTSRHETYSSGNGIDQVYTIRLDTGVIARRTHDELTKINPSWLPRQ